MFLGFCFNKSRQMALLPWCYDAKMAALILSHISA